jgi:predicted TIM-barrel fold metal-dependent hydrolase
MHWSGKYVGFEVTPKWFDPDVTLASMKANGIVVGMPLFYYELELEPAQRLCHETNLGLAEYHALRPNQFHWMAHLPLRFPPAAAELRREAGKPGCRGVLAGTNIAGRRLDEPDYDVFWSAIEELDLPVLLTSRLRTSNSRPEGLLSSIDHRHAERGDHRHRAAEHVLIEDLDTVFKVHALTAFDYLSSPAG